MFTFPELKRKPTISGQLNKLFEEVNEYTLAETLDHQDEEVLDVLHAAETLVLIHFNGREELIAVTVDKIIVKNTAKNRY